MSDLRIARGLALDPDYVAGGTFALLAKKGAGKTYAMRVLAEEFWRAKVPFVALDPMDAFWGLRSSADGEGEGIPVAIFGGPHGDAPLEATGGRLMADLVVDEGLSMVLSTKHFASRADERRFAMDFLDRLYRRNSDLVHLLIDEADLFAPQKPRDKDAMLLAITENIVRRGRNNGIGVTMATQRPAVLNKDVLTQVDGLIVMRMLGPQDRGAIDSWVGEHGDTGQGHEVKGTLPDLETGEAWVWVPELDVLERTKIRTSRTFDSSDTRRRGAKTREPKAYADVDMGAIEQRMGETIERAKAEDPRELKKTIAALRRELSDKSPATPTEHVVEKPVEVLVEVPALSESDLARLEESVQTFGEYAAATIADFDQRLAAVRDAVGPVELALRRLKERPRAEQERTERARAAAAGSSPRGGSTGRASLTPARRPAPPAAESDGDERLGEGELKVLRVLAEFPEGRKKAELAFLAGYSAGASTIRNILARLRRHGLVHPGEPIRPTAEGLDRVGGPVERPVGQELLEHWLRHPRMGEGEQRVLTALVDVYPEAMTKEELCAATGYSPDASTIRNIVARLRKLALLEKGNLRAADELMEAIAA